MRVVRVRSSLNRRAQAFADDHEKEANPHEHGQGEGSNDGQDRAMEYTKPKTTSMAPG